MPTEGLAAVSDRIPTMIEGENVMLRLTAMLLGTVLAGCASVDGSSSAIPVQLLQGDQLKLWGVEARLGADALNIEGQVDRTALPTGPLQEHIHVEILDASGQIVSEHEAHVYPVVALRSQGTARINLRLTSVSMSAGGKVQVRVVTGVPHD